MPPDTSETLKPFHFVASAATFCRNDFSPLSTLGEVLAAPADPQNMAASSPRTLLNDFCVIPTQR